MIIIHLFHLDSGFGRWNSKLQIQYETIEATSTVVFADYSGDNLLIQTCALVKSTM